MLLAPFSGISLRTGRRGRNERHCPISVLVFPITASPPHSISFFFFELTPDMPYPFIQSSSSFSSPSLSPFSFFSCSFSPLLPVFFFAPQLTRGRKGKGGGEGERGKRRKKREITHLRAEKNTQKSDWQYYPFLLVSFLFIRQAARVPKHLPLSLPSVVVVA